MKTIGRLVSQELVSVPAFDTMEIHTLAAVEAALGRYVFDNPV